MEIGHGLHDMTWRAPSLGKAADRRHSDDKVAGVATKRLLYAAVTQWARLAWQLAMVQRARWGSCWMAANL
jgi:hypothetical protein